MGAIDSEPSVVIGRINKGLPVSFKTVSVD